MPAHDDGEQVTFILPSGEKQDFLIPSGMSDAEAKVYVLSRRPDLFQSNTPSFMDAAKQSKRQSMSDARKLMDVGGHRELMNARPSGPSLSKNGQPAATPDVEATLGALPALGGTVGGIFGGVPGAVLGGSGGESLKNLIEMAATGQPTVNPASDIAGEGALQGLFEGGGVLLSKAGKAIAPAILKRSAGAALKGRLDAAGKAIDAYLSQPGVSSESVNIAKPINDIMDKEIARAQKVGASNLADRLSELKDTWNNNYNLKSASPLEANEFRRDLGDITSFAGEANKVTINKIQKQIVGAVGEEIAKVAPGVRPLNDAYANLVATRGAIKQSAKKLTSGFTGTALAATGAATEKAGAVLPNLARTGQVAAPHSASDLLEQIKNLMEP